MLKRNKFWIFTFVAIVFSIIIEVLIIYELNAYEKGFLQVYADEQDGYVTMTVDQINRLGADATEDEITEIISSFDSNAAEYWTLSTGDRILFIKSVTETNRYKNFTSDSYFGSENAVDFIRSLELNEVKHSIIDLSDGRYIASGSLFEWQQEHYRLCLLTYDKAILDQNVILEAKNAIILFTTLVLAVSFSIIIFLVREIEKKTRETNRLKEGQAAVNRQLDSLNNMIRRDNAYSASKNLFDYIVLPEFLREFEIQEVKNICIGVVKLDDIERKTDVIKFFRDKLDNNVVRFQIEEDMYALVFVGYPSNLIKSVFYQLCDKTIKCIGKTRLDFTQGSYIDQWNTFYSSLEVEENEAK